MLKQHRNRKENLLFAGMYYVTSMVRRLLKVTLSVCHRKQPRRPRKSSSSWCKPRRLVCFQYFWTRHRARSLSSVNNNVGICFACNRPWHLCSIRWKYSAPCNSPCLITSWKGGCPFVYHSAYKSPSKIIWFQPNLCSPWPCWGIPFFRIGESEA